MPFESDRPDRVSRIVGTAQAREKIKKVLIATYGADELGKAFDDLPNVIDGPLGNIVAAVGEAWAEHPGRRSTDQQARVNPAEHRAHLRGQRANVDSEYGDTAG